ncbi:MAG TPA: DUF2164 family protein [Caulobacteraceae bacterium]
MPKIAFDRAEREALARRLVRQLRDELDIEVAPMDGQRLLDLLSETLGPAWYNQGLRDAQAALQARVDGIAEAIAGLERPEPR